MRIADLTGLEPSEELRQQLLKEERRLRKRQPPAWTKQKFRKYAIYLQRCLDGKRRN